MSHQMSQDKLPKRPGSSTEKIKKRDFGGKEAHSSQR
jgi:hypothetical protein